MGASLIAGLEVLLAPLGSLLAYFQKNRQAANDACYRDEGQRQECLQGMLPFLKQQVPLPTITMPLNDE